MQSFDALQTLADQRVRQRQAEAAHERLLSQTRRASPSGLPPRSLLAALVEPILRMRTQLAQLAQLAATA